METEKSIKSRRRLPGMHLISALNGQMELNNALAAFFFLVMHNKVNHVYPTQSNQSKSKNWPILSKEDEDGLIRLKYAVNRKRSMPVFEEWSYISESDALTFKMMAEAAIKETQRWICYGIEPPLEVPFGPLVKRPHWAYQSPPQQAMQQVKLREAIAACFFGLLWGHLKRPHKIDENWKIGDQAKTIATSLSNGETFNQILFEGWVRLPIESKLNFFIMANTAVEHVQYWIGAGVEPAQRTSQGPLVERTNCAIRHYGRRPSKGR